MTRIYDSMFAGQEAVHSSGGNAGARPQVVRWRREGDPGRVAWFTDSSLDQAEAVRAEHPGTKIVGWLLEPPELHPETYETAETLEFDALVTHRRVWASEGVARLWYAHGGTRLANRDRTPYPDRGKSELASIVASPKRSLPGHAMRHELIARAGSLVDAFGPEYRQGEKVEALAPYLFHVAFENVRAPGWFTEALIDPMLAGCVPVYWGDPDALERFDARGIVQVDSVDGALEALGRLSVEAYERMQPYVLDNFRRALGYVCTEDWLYRAYPHLFDEQGSI